MRGTQTDPTKLKLSFDRKVSNSGWWYEKYQFWVATTPNSFGLPSGDSCPGLTDFCTSCYAVNAESRNRAVRKVVEHNFNLLQEAGTIPAMAALLHEMVGRYWRLAEFRRIPHAKRIFRIHWDGDFYSEDYALAWYNTIGRFPDIKFWAYTRSFRPPVNVVPILADLDNLKLYLSIDEYNAEDAREMARKYPSVLLAGSAADYKRARDLVNTQVDSRLNTPCPENSGKIDLNEGGVGACVTCMICPDGRRDILFATKRTETTEVQLQLMAKSEGKCICGCGRALPPQVGG